MAGPIQKWLMYRMNRNCAEILILDEFLSLGNIRVNLQTIKISLKLKNLPKSGSRI